MTLAELITEIESQRKWLILAGCNAYNTDIAFASILSAILEYSDTQGNVLEEIRAEDEEYKSRLASGLNDQEIGWLYKRQKGRDNK